MKTDAQAQKNKQNQFARECIVSATMQLLRQKPLSAITIQELTDRAGVSRMTFYRNYKSKEDILISHIYEILTNYQRDDARSAQPKHPFDRAHVTHCLTYFYENRDFVDGLIGCGLSELLLQSLTDYALQKWLTNPADMAERYRLVAFVGMLFNSYIIWRQPPQQGSLEDLISIVSDLCEKAYAES